MSDHPTRTSLLIPAVLACTMACADAAGLPYQRVQELDREVFGCGPNPTNYRISSRAELTRVLERLDRDCRFDDGPQRKARLLRAIEKANVDFERESLIVLEGMYGTGMAKATLALTPTDPDVMTAAITWHVPPPPVTPDTATFRFAFKVDKAKFSKVQVTVNGRQSAVLPIAK